MTALDGLKEARRLEELRERVSIDAALALVERVLPDAVWSVSRPKPWSGKLSREQKKAPYEAYLSNGALLGSKAYRSACLTAQTPALALLSALHRVLAEADAGQEGGA